MIEGVDNRYLFLDIDGVLNSVRTYTAFGKIPFPDEPDAKDFLDPIGIALINRLVKEGVKVILSSTWRLDVHNGDLTLAQMSERIGIPLHSLTTNWVMGSDGKRGAEVDHWLEQNTKNTEYNLFAILDDRADFTDLHKAHHFVHVKGYDGMTYEDYSQVREILGLKSNGIVLL